MATIADRCLAAREDAEIDLAIVSEQAARRIHELERELAQKRATITALQGTLRTCARLCAPYSGDH